jgi:hypothetical protein
MTIVIVVAALIVVGLIPVGIVQAQRETRRERAVWARFAAEHGAAHLLPSGWASGENERIEMKLGGVLVTMETYTRSRGDRRRSLTRWFACCVQPGAPVWKVYREGVMSGIAKSLGSQDVVLCTDPEFDEHFMVKCDNPSTVRGAWTADSMRHMLASFGNGLAQSDGETVELFEGGRLEDFARMQAGFEVVAALAAHREAR